MHITRDKLWKSIIEDFWPDFLRYFFPEIEHLIDFERDALFLDKDLDQLFPDREEGDRRVDILMQVWFKDGTNRWFLVHTEIQGYDDKRFARRMFTYYYRIWDKHHRAITTLVIFLNENPAFQPNRFTRKFAGTELTLTYRTLVLHTMPYESLHKEGNPFGRVLQIAWLGIQAQHIPEEPLDAWLYEHKVLLYRTLLADGHNKARLRKFLTFLQLYVNFTHKDTALRFDTEVLNLANNHKPMGIIELVTEEATRLARFEGLKEGKLEGEQTGERRKLLALIQQLVGGTDFDDQRIAHLVGDTPELVQTIRARMQAGNMRIEDLIPV